MDTGLANVMIAVLATALLTTIIRNKTSSLLSAMSATIANQTTLLATMQEQQRLATEKLGEHTGRLIAAEIRLEGVAKHTHDVAGIVNGMLLKAEADKG